MLQQPIGRLLLHWVPALMLAVALAHWPYGYYQLLRIVVFAAAGVVAWDTYARERVLNVWGAAFLIAALIFNPIAPLHLQRGIWEILNVAAAALFVAHFFATGEQPSPGEQS